MSILVTGGTGLVGSRLLRYLVETGVDCRALVRSGKALPAGVTRVEGDLLNPAALKQAIQGVSAVVHLAAVFRTKDEAANRRRAPTPERHTDLAHGLSSVLYRAADVYKVGRCGRVRKRHRCRSLP